MSVPSQRDPSHPRRHDGPLPGFIDLDTLRDANGIVAIISQRRSNGTLTFGVFKEFERDGRMDRTSFIPELLGEAYEQMVKLARERIAQIKSDLAPPPPVAVAGARSR